MDKLKKEMGGTIVPDLFVMKTESSSQTEKFSVFVFAVTIVFTLVPVFFVMWLVTPQSIWDVQWNATAGQYVTVFGSSQFVNCFVEWAFHRYMLHAPIFPGFEKLFKTHHFRHHLTHTNVVPRGEKWHSNYAIEEDSQHESSFFPWYSLLGFLVFATPFAALVQWLLPTWPILTMVVFSTVWSLVFYELVHAVEHLPNRVWNKILDRGGVLAEKAYSFHLIHHAHLKCNEAISGCFGLPLADLLFGTLKTSRVLFRNGAPVLQEDLIVPPPLFFVRWFDRFAEKRIKDYRARR